MAAFTISRRENSLDKFKLFSKGSPSQSPQAHAYLESLSSRGCPEFLNMVISLLVFMSGQKKQQKKKGTSADKPINVQT